MNAYVLVRVDLDFCEVEALFAPCLITVTKPLPTTTSVSILKLMQLYTQYGGRMESFNRGYPFQVERQEPGYLT